MDRILDRLFRFPLFKIIYTLCILTCSHQLLQHLCYLSKETKITLDTAMRAITLGMALLLVFSRIDTTFALVASKSASLYNKVAVIGATGRVGRRVIQKLVERRVPVKILLRQDLSQIKEVPSALNNDLSSTEVAAYLASLPNVEVVKGDVTNEESVKALINDVSAVLAVHGAIRRSKLSDALPWSKCEEEASHAKQVNYEGVRHIINACKESDSTCKRIVRITGKGEDPYSFFSVMINLLGSMAKAWNNEGEHLLRESGLDYTIIRPGVMRSDDENDESEDKNVLALADNGDDLPVSAIKYATIAELCIECLAYDNAAKSTLCAMCVEPGKGEDTYAPLLEIVKPDSRTFQRFLGAHKEAVRNAASIIAFMASVVFVGFASAIRNVFLSL